MKDNPPTVPPYTFTRPVAFAHLAFRCVSPEEGGEGGGGVIKKHFLRTTVGRVKIVKNFKNTLMHIRARLPARAAPLIDSERLPQGLLDLLGCFSFPPFFWAPLPKTNYFLTP